MAEEQLSADWQVAGLTELADSSRCPLSRTHLYRAKRSGSLQTIKAGRRVLIRREIFDAWLNEGAPIGVSQ